MILQLHKHATISLCACITMMFLTSAGMAAWSSTEMPIMPHVSKGIHITYSKTTHALALPKAEVNRMVSAAQAMKGPEVIKQFVNGAKSRVKKVSVPVIAGGTSSSIAYKMYSIAHAECSIGFKGEIQPTGAAFRQYNSVFWENVGFWGACVKDADLTARIAVKRRILNKIWLPLVPCVYGNSSVFLW